MGMSFTKKTIFTLTFLLNAIFAMAQVTSVNSLSGRWRSIEDVSVNGNAIDTLNVTYAFHQTGFNDAGEEYGAFEEFQEVREQAVSNGAEVYVAYTLALHGEYTYSKDGDEICLTYDASDIDLDIKGFDYRTFSPVSSVMARILRSTLIKETEQGAEFNIKRFMVENNGKPQKLVRKSSVAFVLTTPGDRAHDVEYRSTVLSHID